MAAGRVMLARLRELAAARASFAFETTLATRSFAPWIRELVDQGYEFHLVFFCLPSAEVAVQRVVCRVRSGGHDVPRAAIEGRYVAGMANLRLYLPLAKSWRFIDNLTGKPQVAHGLEGPASGIEPADLEGFLALLGEAVDRHGATLPPLEAQIEAAAQRAVRRALIEHKRAGNPVVFWENGQIRWAPADEIKVPPPGDAEPPSQGP